MHDMTHEMETALCVKMRGQGQEWDPHEVQKVRGTPTLQIQEGARKSWLGNGRGRDLGLGPPAETHGLGLLAGKAP